MPAVSCALCAAIRRGVDNRKRLLKRTDRDDSHDRTRCNQQEFLAYLTMTQVVPVRLFVDGRSDYQLGRKQNSSSEKDHQINFFQIHQYQ
jgi:hypothetical protein